jgi:DNA-binding response OmpR family regulator
MATTILVVDDEPDLIEIVRFRLEKDGYKVLSAGDGRAGLAAAIEKSPDLVVLDVMMPGLDGFEVLFQMKNNPKTKDTPVVMLTAKTDMSSISKGWGMDVDNYVTKPFNVDDLAKTVKNVLVFRGKLPQD